MATDSERKRERTASLVRCGDAPLYSNDFEHRTLCVHIPPDSPIEDEVLLRRSLVPVQFRAELEAGNLPEGSCWQHDGVTVQVVGAPGSPQATRPAPEIVRTNHSRTPGVTGNLAYNGGRP